MAGNVLDLTPAQKRTISELQSRDGELRAPMLVYAAADDRSPLHPLFEWNNQKAGHEYRLVQAERLIQRVKVSVVATGEVLVTAHVNRHHEVEVVSRKNLKIVRPNDPQQLREKARRELQQFVARYEVLEPQFPDIAAIITTIRKQLDAG